MHLSSFITLLAITTLTATLAFASHHAPKRNHAAIGREETGMSLFKRIDNARLTYFADGLGACGKTNKPSDFIVALNSAQFAGGIHCFEMITITYQGKSTQAQIMDECPGCPFGGLDCSEGLFNYLASESAGVIYGSWDFADAKPVPIPSLLPTPKMSPEAKETSTYSPPPPSSSTMTRPSAKAKVSSSSHATTTTTSSTSSTSSSTSSSSSATPTSTAPINKAAATAGTIAPQQAAQSTLYAINEAFMGLSGLVTEALSVFSH